MNFKLPKLVKNSIAINFYDYNEFKVTYRNESEIKRYDTGKNIHHNKERANIDIDIEIYKEVTNDWEWQGTLIKLYPDDLSEIFYYCWCHCEYNQEMTVLTMHLSVIFPQLDGCYETEITQLQYCYPVKRLNSYEIKGFNIHYFNEDCKTGYTDLIPIEAVETELYSFELEYDDQINDDGMLIRIFKDTLLTLKLTISQQLYNQIIIPDNGEIELIVINRNNEEKSINCHADIEDENADDNFNRKIYHLTLRSNGNYTYYTEIPC